MQAEGTFTQGVGGGGGGREAEVCSAQYFCICYLSYFAKSLREIDTLVQAVNSSTSGPSMWLVTRRRMSLQGHCIWNRLHHICRLHDSVFFWLSVAERRSVVSPDVVHCNQRHESACGVVGIFLLPNCCNISFPKNMLLASLLALSAFFVVVCLASTTAV